VRRPWHVERRSVLRPEVALVKGGCVSTQVVAYWAMSTKRL
jgi:hypothetical protein